MPTPAQDLHDKLTFEADLRPKLKKLNADIVRDFTDQYRKTGTALDASQYNEPLTELLTDHYIVVSDEFSSRVRGELPRDAGITHDEEALIASSLLTWILLKTPSQASIINATTQENILDSIALALDDSLVRKLSGVEARLTAAAIARGDLKRRLAGREEGVIMTETQIAAETGKATEIEVLSGITPSIDGGTPEPSEVMKEWVSVGDHRVRPEHLAADGQIVSINDAFTVGGESLRWPGDAELGASLGNIINCRCSSNTDTSAIIEARQK